MPVLTALMALPGVTAIVGFAFAFAATLCLSTCLLFSFLPTGAHFGSCGPLRLALALTPLCHQHCAPTSPNVVRAATTATRTVSLPVLILFLLVLAFLPTTPPTIALALAFAQS